MLRTMVLCTLFSVGGAVFLTACGNGGSAALLAGLNASISETTGVSITAADLQPGGKWQVSARVGGVLDCDPEPTIIQIKRCDENSGPRQGERCTVFGDCRPAGFLSGNCVVAETIEYFSCRVDCAACQRSCDLGLLEICLNCREAGCDSNKGTRGDLRRGRIK